MSNAELKSGEEAIAYIVKHFGLECYKFPPYESWNDLQNSREECGLERQVYPEGDISEDLHISFSCMEAFHSYLSGCALSAFSKLIINKKICAKSQAGFTLFSGMASDAEAIILLCRNGFDIQAKAVVRALREKIDYLIGVQLDRGFAVEFVKADGPLEANEFSHRRVARGKLKKMIARRLGHYAQGGESPIDEEWFRRRNNLERWLGEAVHPSHTTGLLSAFPRFGEDNASIDDIYGSIGAASAISIRTARTVLGFALEVLTLVRWRDLASAESFHNLGGDGGDAEFYELHVNLEKFLHRCTYESLFKPNEDIHKLMLYFRGLAVVPQHGEVDWETYDKEMVGAMIRLLESVKSQLESKMAGFDMVKKDP